MLKLFAVVILLIIAFFLLVLRGVYNLLPILEIKRRARNDDVRSHKLYKAVVYQRDVSLLFLILAGLANAAVFIIIAKSFLFLLALVTISLLIWLNLLLPILISSTTSAQSLAVWLAPVVGRCVNNLRPILKKIIRVIDKLRPKTDSTRMYQIDDLLELIEQQASERDNRIPTDRLTMASRALTFGDISVKDVMTPKRMVVTANAKDNVGPLLMEELHKSGHSRFPVFDKKPDEIVGTLYLKDVLNYKKAGTVADVMKKGTYFVHEDHPLEQVFHAFIKTKHHLFIVVNKFEEVVGVISIEDVIEQIVGRKIVDEFDQYDDLRAVAQNLAKEEHDQKSTEVIE